MSRRGPLVRSSYHAAEVFIRSMIAPNERGEVAAEALKQRKDAAALAAAAEIARQDG